jgi:Uma2 family endonuclease
MGMAATTYYTADMVRALPDDGKRYETVYGELLVTPAPRLWHQLIVQRLTTALAQYLEREHIGQVFASPADISWAPDVLVQPDVFVADLAEARTLEWSRVRHLLAAAEVLSPSSVRADRFAKRRLYQEVGIPIYWLVDPDGGQVEVWRPGDTLPALERARLLWTPEHTEQSFVLELADLFRSI